jgi:hypothetical protein
MMIKVIQSEARGWEGWITVKGHNDEVIFNGPEIDAWDLANILQQLGIDAQEVSPNYDPLDE